MSAATSPAPWIVNASGGAMTIVARDRSVVAIVMGSGSAAPFESSNAHLLAAGPEMREALERCSELFSTIRGDWTDPRSECREGQELIRAALAKAVGP